MIVILFWIVSTVLVVYAGYTYVQFSKNRKVIESLQEDLKVQHMKQRDLLQENQQLQAEKSTLAKLVLDYTEQLQAKNANQ